MSYRPPAALLLTIPLSASACQASTSAPSAEPHKHAEHAHHGGPLVHRFEHAEQWAQDFDDPERDSWQRPSEVIEALELSEGMTVADIGAGTGYFLPYLSQAVGEKGLVLGLDIEPDMVRYMTERAQRQHLRNVKAQLSSPNSPRLGPQSLDRALVVNVWHHIDQRDSYAKELFSGIRPSGQVLIVDFTLESPKGPPAEHRIRPEQVIKELQGAGFAAELVKESLPNQYIVKGEKR